jgi:hypothetical protein
VGGLVALYLHPRIPHENFLHPQLKASGNDRRCYRPPWSSGTNTARRLAAFAAVSLLLAPLRHPECAERCPNLRCKAENILLALSSSQFDPNVWSGRALQEDFVELAAAVLHQCIRPQIGACCAPGHHGYQRACVLISGQTSIGPFGSPVFARARKTDPPFCLVLSQTSAGNC